MTILLWWTLASTCVSLFLGAFLAYARREDETLHLDLDAELNPQPDVRKTQANLT
jgi:hypothetical protein